MKVTVSHIESSFNRAKRKKDKWEVVDGFWYVPAPIDRMLKELATEYRLNVAEMVGLALFYYFGDGKNHLACEHCEWFEKEGCGFPELNEQTTMLT